MLRLSCYITGDDYEMLKQDTPESRKKVSALASLLLIPVLIWFANGYLMVSKVLEGSTSNAILIAIFLSLLIFLIERNIIMVHNNKAINRFRYLLGFVIALLGAICLDEAIFKEDIDMKMEELNQQSVDKSIAGLDSGSQEELERLQEDVDTKYRNWQTAMNDAKQEADGTSGSGIKGVHAITRIKLEQADVYKADYNKAVQKLDEIKGDLASKKEQRKIAIENAQSNHALLQRIKALFRLVFSDLAMGIIYCLFTLFLFIMEFLVVFMKSKWPVTNYERKLQAIEEIGKKRLDLILQNDLKQFEPFREYPRYKDSVGIIESTNSSIYN